MCCSPGLKTRGPISPVSVDAYVVVRIRPVATVSDMSYWRSKSMRSAELPWPKLAAPRHERRGERRLPAPNALRCTLSGLRAKLIVKDVSASGLAVWANMPLPVGREYDLTIKLAGFALSRRARIVHCKCKGTTEWLTGLTFVSTSDDDGKIDELIKLMATEFRAE